MAITPGNMYSGPIATFKVGGDDIGGTNDGVEITEEEEYSEIHCDQILGPLARSLNSRKFTVITNLAELTLANLKIALGLGDDAVSSSQPIKDTELGVTTLEITVPCPTGVGTRTIKFDTVYKVAGGGIAFKKDGTQTVLPVTFSCIGDSVGFYGFIKDVE